MHHLTTRELLYLEDLSKLFEAIAKNSSFAAQNAVDPQLKSYLQSLEQEHKQWISATNTIVSQHNLQ